jgi:hypothetical protein
LILANAMHQLNACQSDRGVPEAFETEHDVRSELDVAIILLDEIIQILEVQTFVSSGSKPSAFVSRTARCEAA